MKKQKENLSPVGEIPMTCEKCNYVWFARKQQPRQCPNCKRQIKYITEDIFIAQLIGKNKKDLKNIKVIK